jgi:hypothetical protein
MKAASPTINITAMLAKVGRNDSRTYPTESTVTRIAGGRRWTSDEVNLTMPFVFPKKERKRFCVFPPVKLSRTSVVEKFIPRIL